MRKVMALLIFCGFVPTVTLLGARMDVHRDGVLNDEDVRILGRMVAGLDPIDLDCDQNGDHVITLADVNLLLMRWPPQPARLPMPHGAP